MGNQERNTYVINQIVLTSIKLLKEKQWEKISISEIIQQAQVSRNSFYRNFETKDDILKNYLNQISKEWLPVLEKDLSFSEKLKVIFSHCEHHQTFYQSLHEQGLLNLFKDIMTDSMDLAENSTALEAYIKSYVIYMLYGFVETWLHRGMKESAEEIAILFSVVK